MDLNKARLLVTPTSYGKNDPRLITELEALTESVKYNPTGKPLSSNEVAELLPGVDGVWCNYSIRSRLKAALYKVCQ